MPFGSNMMPFAPSGAGWEPWGWGRSLEAMYIWFYSGTLIATLGPTVAKARRCGACRRLVSTDSEQWYGEYYKAKNDVASPLTVNSTNASNLFGAL
jgi:hypothetical protein